MGLIRESMLKFKEHKAMNEKIIIDRKLFTDLAKEVGLNALHIEALGEVRHCEIIVSGDMLERLVEIQHQFEQLTVMGDDEYRGFYIEVPRPTPEEWGDVEELIASGEYRNKEAFLADWLTFNPTETQWFHIASYRYEELRSIRVTDRKHTHFIITNRSSYAGGESDEACVGIPLPSFSTICRGWLMLLLQISMGSTTMWRTICRTSNGLGGLHERNSIG